MNGYFSLCCSLTQFVLLCVGVTNGSQAVSRSLAHSLTRVTELQIRQNGSDCNIRDYGAKGDNQTEDTAALRAALLACAGSESGAVIVPEGTYLIKPVQIPSDSHLVLMPFSTLTAWPDRYTWPNSTNKPCDFAQEGSSCCLKNIPGCCVAQKESLLWAMNASNILIEGGGIIDGNANANAWHHGPSNVSADGKHVNKYYSNYWHLCRPRMVEVRYSSMIEFRNITVQNSIMFNFHTAHVDKLRISNITINSLGPNTDGFNVAGTDMEIRDSTVCNNDDCIPVNAPTDGLLVENVNCTRGGGFVPMIGDKDTTWGADCVFVPGNTRKTSCSPRGNISNVLFRNSFFSHTSTAVITKSMPVFEGSIINVTWENLRLDHVGTGVCMNTASQSCSAHSGSHSLQRMDVNGLQYMNLKGLTIRNITGSNVGLAGFMNCPGGNCTGLTLTGINFPGAQPYYCDGHLEGTSVDCNPPACSMGKPSTQTLPI